MTFFEWVIQAGLEKLPWLETYPLLEKLQSSCFVVVIGCLVLLLHRADDWRE